MMADVVQAQLLCRRGRPGSYVTAENQRGQNDELVLDRLCHIILQELF
jgi:ribosomal protein L33